MRSWVTLFIGGCGLLLATRAQALGVGEPLTVSPLNRPLHAVLPLTASAELEPGQVTVTLADAAAYRRSGLTPDALGDGISARVEKRDGGLAIVLDSDQRVREPFLDLLLTVSWPQGQWQRDVSLLFDPPDYAATQPLLAAAEAASSEVAAAAWPQTLTVAPGATLSTLAAALPPHQGVSREAAMLALYRANRHAFEGGNLDRLRAGVRLDVPRVATVEALADQAPQALRALREAATDTDAASPAGSESLGQQRSAQASGSADTAAVTRQIAALTRQTQRQQATIADLERQRERLQAALAARATPLETGDVSEGVGEAAVVAAKGLAGSTGNASTSSTSASSTPASSAPASSTPTSSTSTSSTSSVTTAEASSANDGGAVSGSTPTAGEAAAESAASSSAAATSLAKSTPLPPSASSTSSASTAPNDSAAAPSLWQRAVSWAPLLGALALLGLLWLLLWQRRRSRAQTPHTGEVEASGDNPETHVEASGKPRRWASGALLGRIGRAVTRRGGQQEPAEAEAGAASISQADIYIAYGRFAAARDWLEPRLTEDPRHRLSLIRALGELREIEAMEQVLAEFDDSASREQRRTAEALAADYRARHVDESWAVATDHAEAAAADTAAATLLAEDEGALSLARVEDVDALFDAALGGDTSPLPQSPLPQSPLPRSSPPDTAASSEAPSLSGTTPAPEVPPAPEKTFSSDSATTGSASAPSGVEGSDAENGEPPGDAAPTLALEPLPHAFDVAPETLGAGPPATADRAAAESGERLSGTQENGSETGETLEAGAWQDGAAAVLPAQERGARRRESGDDATAAALTLGDDPAPQALRIDYQAPTLELDETTPPPSAQMHDASPEIELPPLDLDSQTWRPLGEPAPAEMPSQDVGAATPGGVSARGSAPGSPAAENRPAENESPEKTSPQSPSSSNTSEANTSKGNTSKGNTSDANTAPGHPSGGKASPQHPVSPGDTSLQRGIPVGWEVEEVEFEPLHRDNGRP
ncbi:FimV/HubP family polar landmark protein [Salinicola tamaricis]|uniref:FimV/HubP family polar landmark protein n=1 Tax=Salinicola tamaricis TaxID=1771309 RepID=UPI00101ADAF1|nr:FimV/HubP family polar landmark protein [Salinicola tamaricis]